MDLSHYSDAPLGKIEPRERQAAGFKPDGIWVSVDGPDDWDTWCREQDFRVQCLAVQHRITLAAGANVLRIETEEELDNFSAAYRIDLYPGRNLQLLGIDWVRVSARHDGIIIAPYQWSRRLHDDARWYYGWDCASGCIWQPRAIAAVEVFADRRTQEAA